MTLHMAYLNRLVHYQRHEAGPCVAAVAIDPIIGREPITLAILTPHPPREWIEAVPYDEDRGPRTWHRHHDRQVASAESDDEASA